MIDYDDIPKYSGLYYLFDEELLLYIGKAINIKNRLKQHRVDNFLSSAYIPPCEIDYAWNQITKLIFEPVDKIFLSIIEIIMIRKLKPILNYQTRRFYFPVDSYLDQIHDKDMKKLDDYWKRITEKKGHI